MRYTQTGVTLASYGWQPIPEPPLPKGGGGVAAGGIPAAAKQGQNSSAMAVTGNCGWELNPSAPNGAAPFSKGALCGGREPG